MTTDQPEATTPVRRRQANLALGQTPVRFASTPSACPVAGFTAADRADPFWHGMWGDGAQASWVSRRLADRLRADGITPTRSDDLALTPRQAVEAVADRGRRQRHPSRIRETRLAALAVVGMWRTVSAQQLAAFTGVAGAAHRSLMAMACQAGLVDRGTLLSELATALGHQHNHLYRPVETPLFDDLAQRLSYAELVAVCAGMDWTRGPQHDRHNILAAELGLRAAEYLEVGAVLGESVSRLDLLADRVATNDIRRADATIVRPDGHRIAVELTSSVGGQFVKKVDRWAQTLAGTDPTRTGLSVVFLDASVPDRPNRIRKRVWTTIRAAVGRAAYAVPGAVRNQVPERMAVARWEWWFPAPRAFAPSFRSLRAERPTAAVPDRWREVHLLDPFDLEFDPHDPGSGQAVLHNARWLWGAPVWLRDRRAPDLGTALLSRSGLRQTIRLPTTGEYQAARRRA